MLCQNVEEMRENSLRGAQPTPTLRIACLEPSATAICQELGLGEYIVGVTHECEPILAEFYSRGDNVGVSTDESHNLGLSKKRPLVLTRSGLKVDSQADIHLAIQRTAAAAALAASNVVCPIQNKNGEIPPPTTDIPSMYPLIEERIQSVRPTVIFTQDLCEVCAPTSSDVRRCLLKNAAGCEDNAEDTETSPAAEILVSVVALQPTNLFEVTDTFVTIAKACGIPERGQKLKNDFLSKLKALRNAIHTNRQNNDDSTTMPTMFILEWLDPVFDSGHWTYQMMEYACVQTARPKKTHKAMVIEWNDVYAADPDVIVVGCCGFDLERNVRDTLTKREQLRKLRAGRNHRIYASNGDWYIAQPAPFLLQGVALLAQCAYQNEPSVLDAIAKLGFDTIGWQAVNVMTTTNNDPDSKSLGQLTFKESVIGDIEDLFSCDEEPGFSQLHNLACEQGELTYVDPETGYAVFTKVAHERRGKCCGSGCRHCPYSHANVKNKAAKIQQPSLLYQQIDDSIFSIKKNKKIKVLFFSGGKDSFLTIRALVRSHNQDGPFGLILVTTFDATTRIIAHQEVGIDQVIKQASHLDINLVGIPLRRGSGETYTDRIQCGLQLIQNLIQPDCHVSSLVFGDLHLSHVKEWRDKVLTKLDCQLEYPLWKKTYSDLLRDLEASKVPCVISGSEQKEVPVGIPFDRNLYERLVDSDVDSFGECGEFHSLVMIWEVPRLIALGLAK